MMSFQRCEHSARHAFRRWRLMATEKPESLPLEKYLEESNIVLSPIAQKQNDSTCNSDYLLHMDILTKLFVLLL